MNEKYHAEYAADTGSDCECIPTEAGVDFTMCPRHSEEGWQAVREDIDPLMPYRRTLRQRQIESYLSELRHHADEFVRVAQRLSRFLES